MDEKKAFKFIAGNAIRKASYIDYDEQIDVWLYKRNGG